MSILFILLRLNSIFSLVFLSLSFLSNVDAKKAIKGVPHLGLVNPQIADHRVYEGLLVTKSRTKA